ncbi:MAG: DUF3179 domain-containing protein [Pseudomonadota bacterium]
MNIKNNYFLNKHLLKHSFQLFIFCFLFITIAQAQNKNGFDLSNSSINSDEVFSGGPAKDGIPAINTPKFIAAKKVDFLQDNDIVIGFTHKGKARAYPTRILIWHEIVNDVFDDLAIAVTYCPLCGTAMVFDRKVKGQLRTFGVSGLLYQSDVLMYDRETESLWSQLAMQAVSGEEKGNKLDWLVSEHMSWQAWLEKYPQSMVLSTDTGYSRNYRSKAYTSYFTSPYTMFPAPYTRTELAKKTWVIGIIINNKSKAYAVNKFTGNKKITDKLGGKEIIISYDVSSNQPYITDSKGESVAFVMVYWFAWQAFYPQSQLWNGAD